MALFLAYLCSGSLLFALALPLWALGLLDQNFMRALPGHLVTGPYYPGGAWPIATDLSVAAVMVAVTTLTVDWMLRWQTDFAVSRRLLFLALALTGGAPSLGVHLLPASGGLAFVATLVVVRWKAVPVPATAPDRWPWRLCLGLLVLTALLIGSYTTFHPLRTTGIGGSSRSAVATVRNSGPGTVTLLGSDVRASVWPPAPHPHIAGVILPPRASVTLTFRMPCPRSVVHVRYRLFGRTWSQPLPLTSSCPA